MELEKAKEIYEQIVDLCYEVDSSKLTKLAESIYLEVETARDLNKVISSCTELVIAINEEEFTDEEQDTIQDILEMIESLSE